MKSIKYKRRKSQCEICGASNLTLDVHHIIPRAQIKNDNPYNLACICPNCHRKIHVDGSIKILGKFMTSDGLKLITDESACKDFDLVNG